MIWSGLEAVGPLLAHSLRHEGRPLARAATSPKLRAPAQVASAPLVRVERWLNEEDRADPVSRYLVVRAWQSLPSTGRIDADVVFSGITRYRDHTIPRGMSPWIFRARPLSTH